MNRYDEFLAIRGAVSRMQSAASKLPPDRWPDLIVHMDALTDSFAREAAARARKGETNVVR